MALPVIADESEVHVGRTAAGQLKIHVEFTQPLELPASIFPGISGYATGLVGFHSTELDEPAEDFFQLSTASDFRFILVAKTPGMEVWNDHGSGYMAVGESFFVGVAPFDTHPIWNIVNGTPGNSYTLTLKVRDLNGIYPDSEPFDLSFTPEFPAGPFQIGIRKADSIHAELLWSTNAVGWMVESAASVVAGSWDTLTNAPDISGTNFSLSISTSEEQQFFRLRKP